MEEELINEGAQEIPVHDMMELFETLSFSEKWHKVFAGLKMAPDSGEYKWAKLQIKRLWGPACGVVVPVILLLLLTLVAGMNRRQPRQLKVIIRDEPPVEQLEEPPPIEEEPLEPPEPTEVEADSFNEHDVMMEDVEPTPPSDFAPQPALFDSVALIKSPVIMRGIYGSRSPGARGRARGQYGGSGMTEGAVMRALRWLKKYQNQDGSWNQTKPAMTGLALLTFLAHGETPASEEFGMTVEYAIKWLIENQEGDGRFKGRDGHDYSHPIAAYALAEAYGLTKVPTIKEAAEKAIKVVISGQNPTGGFNYNLVAGGTAGRDDSSYMAWCSQALKAAYMAGLSCDGLDQAMTKAVAGWKKNYGGTYDKGGFGYTGPSDSHGLSAAGALSMQLLGQGNTREVTSTMNAMEGAGFWGQGGYSQVYYSYYLTQAKFHEGGARWKTWNKVFSPALIQHQIVEKNAIEGPDGKMKDVGHWAPDRGISGHTDPEGRVMNTCLCALQLQVYYRYLPTFQKPDEAPVQNIVNEKDGDVDIRIDGG